MRFTIRDLLWLTVVLALGVAWWIERARSSIVSDRLRTAERILVAEGWEVEWDDRDPFPIFKIPVEKSALTPKVRASAENLPSD